MNIIENKIQNKIQHIFSDENYFNIYNTIFEENKNNNNIKILVINQKLFLSIHKLGHFIKKYNMQFTFYFEKEKESEKNIFLNKIKGEEYENNINVCNSLVFNNNILYDKIILFHLYDKEYLNIILNSIKHNINYDTYIHVYCSLCNKDENITYKNKIRDAFKNLTKLEFGKLLLYEDLFDSIDNKYFFIEKEKILKETKYIFYGINKLYEIIIKKIIV
jgi:hypothetical protein